MVEYQGMMVPKDTFRAFVYGNHGAKKLANSWDEYTKLVGSGIWFDSIENIVLKSEKITDECEIKKETKIKSKKKG